MMKGGFISFCENLDVSLFSKNEGQVEVEYKVSFTLYGLIFSNGV